MSTIAIVYYRRHPPTRRYAELLGSLLQDAGHLAELISVKDASAHEIVFFDGVILMSPPRFGRLHGIALARAISPARSTAVVAIGGRHRAGHYRRLFKKAELPSITVMVQPLEDRGFSTAAALLEWAGSR